MNLLKYPENIMRQQVLLRASRKLNLSTSEPQFPGHLGSNPMLKNVGFMNQKIEMLRLNKASHCKIGNVLYPQGHLVTWLSVYSVNISYLVQNSTFIEIELKRRNVANANRFKKNDLFSIEYQ